MIGNLYWRRDLAGSACVNCIKLHQSHIYSASSPGVKPRQTLDLLLLTMTLLIESLHVILSLKIKPVTFSFRIQMEIYVPVHL